VKQYARLGPEIQDALERYAADVRSGSFPEDKHTYSIPEEELELFEATLEERAREHH
jgi:3-methyl-2-oxobutanoate hydroxymethyltransferase